jgi:hypothetical protein
MTCSGAQPSRSHDRYSCGLVKIWPGSIFGAKPEGNETFSTAHMVIIFGVVTTVAGIVFAITVRIFGNTSEDEPSQVLVQDPDKSPFRGGIGSVGEPAEETRRRLHEGLMLGAAAFAGALATLLVGRDLAMKPEGAEMSGGIRLLQLFTYNYKRPWPDTLDFSAVLGAFTLVAGILGVALAVRSLRRHAVMALCAFGLLWAVWGLDVYMMALSPHWGQHEVIEAYYRDRNNPTEILVAYQMNWKGENFYTGNHIPAFVSSGATFQTWLKKEKEKGATVMYFITEHSRTSGLRSEVAGKSYKEITDKALNNKFVVVRAEL